MNVGIVGCGGIAQAHAAALERISDVDKIIAHDPKPESVAALALLSDKVFEARTLEELAANCDAFIVCTPNSIHLPVISEVLKCHPGIPFLCEKPLASSLSDAECITLLAPPRSGTGFNYRFNPVVQYIKKIIDGSEFGKMVSFDASFCRDSALRRKKFTWRDGSSQRLSSGALGDLGSHLIDLFAWLGGNKVDASSVRFVAATRIAHKESTPVMVDDHSLAIGRNVAGVPFNIRVSKATPIALTGFQVNIVFESAEVRYNSSQAGVVNIEYHNDSSIVKIEIDDKVKIADPAREIKYWSDSILQQDLLWIESIHEGSDRIATICDGLDVQRIVEKLKHEDILIRKSSSD